MHQPEICSLDGVVGVEGVRDPIDAIVVGTTCYLCFISYALTLTALGAVGLYWWRLSSCVLSCIASDVLLLGASSIGYIVGSVSCSVSDGVGWRVGHYVGGSVDQLRHFVLASSFFSHRLKGGVVVVVVVVTRSLRPTPGVGA
jgi:hypothetical protein